jgi:hypothetical protein
MPPRPPSPTWSSSSRPPAMVEVAPKCCFPRSHFPLYLPRASRRIVSSPASAAGRREGTPSASVTCDCVLFDEMEWGRGWGVEDIWYRDGSEEVDR